MTADGSGRTLRFGGRFARLLCLVATLLLFVAPAHATMQDIACEHLPQSFEQLFDKTKTSKLILRADNGPCAAAIAAEFEPDEGHPLLVPVATRLTHDEVRTVDWQDVSAPCLAERAILSAPPRAPPFI